MTAYTPLSNFVLAAPRLKVQKKPVAVDKPPVVKKQLSEEELELKRKNDRERKRKSRANGGVEKKEEENSKKRTKRANLVKVQLDAQREKERQWKANQQKCMSQEKKEAIRIKNEEIKTTATEDAMPSDRLNAEIGVTKSAKNTMTRTHWV